MANHGIDGDRRQPVSRFDTQINVTTIISLMALLLAIWGASNRLEGRIMSLETKVDALWMQYQKGY